MNLSASKRFISVSFIPFCITRYVLQTWYILLLSNMTYILATATLLSSYVFFRVYGSPDLRSLSGSVGDGPWGLDGCGLNDNTGENLYAICSSSR